MSLLRNVWRSGSDWRDRNDPKRQDRCGGLTADRTHAET
jgi:hypothetical protein